MQAQTRSEDIRTNLVARLQARRLEIEQATLTRIYAISNLTEAAEPEYLDGLRAAVSAALEYGLASLGQGERRPPPIPNVLLAQARLAALHSVSLDTVLRRYFAGYALLGDFLMEEAEKEAEFVGVSELKRLLRNQATLFDRLLAVISEEYTREAERRLDTSEQLRAQHVQRLLNGELVDPAELSYEFNANHLGSIIIGPRAQEAARALSRALDCQLLAIRNDDGTVWAWFGTRRQLKPGDVERVVVADWAMRISLAIGEPGHGIAGWRFTHHQARAALPIAIHRPHSVVRYADVALLASMLRDDVLATSMRELYLAPLSSERDGGETLRTTLRAYFAADRNVSSTASALRVSRQTVVNRIRRIEERFERSLVSCAAEVETALRLENLEYRTPPEKTSLSGGYVSASKGLQNVKPEQRN